MVSIMESKCTEDTTICLSKFRGCMKVAMFQLDLQTSRKQVGKWRKIFQAKRFAHAKPWSPEKNYNYFFSILFLNTYVSVTNPPPNGTVLLFLPLKGKG